MIFELQKRPVELLGELQDDGVVALAGFVDVLSY